MTKLRSARADFDGWAREVREPAEKAYEGKRTIIRGKAAVSYWIAPLPTGSWEIRIRCENMSATLEAMGISWREFATQEACLAYFTTEAERFFSTDADRRITADQKRA